MSKGDRNMKQLPNGATILQILEGHKTCAVLADTGRDYVTWLFQAGDQRSTYWGHYFPKEHYGDARALMKAEADLKKRSKNI